MLRVASRWVAIGDAVRRGEALQLLRADPEREVRRMLLRQDEGDLHTARLHQTPGRVLMEDGRARDGASLPLDRLGDVRHLLGDVVELHGSSFVGP